MYLGWYDDGKRTAESKIAEAIDAYVSRFKAQPNVVLVNPDEDAPARVRGCEIRREGYIRRNNFWVGVTA